MDRIIISGGPHTGKTTLLRSLQEIYPHYNYVPEPASAVLDSLREKRETTQNWREIIDSPLVFCTLCIKQSIISERAVDEKSGYTFQDRSLIDTIAYARRDGCEELVPAVKALAKQAAYSMVLFCEPVGEISGRIESPKEALATHELLRAAYHEEGIPYVSLPPVTTKERIEIVSSILQ